MYRSGICPKCGSKDIMDTDRKMGDKAMYHRIACMDCGYVEMQCTDKHREYMKDLRSKGKI